MEKWNDLSIAIDEDFLVYPGDPNMKIEETKTIFKDKYNLKTVTMGMHVGTHMDFKAHMLETDVLSEDFDIQKLIGLANVVRPRVVENIIQTEDIIEAYDMAKYQAEILILDLKHAKKVNTREYYDQPKFQDSIFPFLIAKGINVLACDMPTVAYCDSIDVLQMHYDLLGNDITIIENLTNLESLSDLVDFIALPIKIKNIDGSPVRAVAKNINFG